MKLQYDFGLSKIYELVMITNKLYDECKIKLIIESLNKEIESKKIPKSLALGISLTFGLIANIIVMVNTIKWFSTEFFETVSL